MVLAGHIKNKENNKKIVPLWHYKPGLVALKLIECWSDNITKNFFYISAFWITYIGGAWWKHIHSPNLVGIGSWGPRDMAAWIPNQPHWISVNWPGSKQLWTRPIYTHFRLHTTKNISPSPTLQFGGVFCIDVDQGSLVNKKNEK